MHMAVGLPTQGLHLLLAHPLPLTPVPQADYQAALDVLLLAEEAFTLCNPSLTEGIDNVGMLLVDIVWCVGMQAGASREEGGATVQPGDHPSPGSSSAGVGAPRGSYSSSR